MNTVFFQFVRFVTSLSLFFLLVMATVYTVLRARQPSGSSLSLLLLLGLCFASHTQSVDGGAAGAAGRAMPAMTLRGGADAAAAGTPQDAGDAEAYMKEQLDYWNSLSKEQQDAILANMSPEERANAEGEFRGLSAAAPLRRRRERVRDRERAGGLLYGSMRAIGTHPRRWRKIVANA